MTDVEFFAHYGETEPHSVLISKSPPSTVARRIFELHRRHAAAVCNVFDDGVDANKAEIRNGSLPADCLVSLVVGQGAVRLHLIRADHRPKIAAAPASRNTNVHR